MANRPARPTRTPGTTPGWRGDWSRKLINGKGPEVMAGLSDAEAARLVELARGRSVLEVGSAWGYSTILMACVARSVVAVDPHKALDSLIEFTANLVGHGVADRVEVLVLPSRVALPALHRAGRRFELIFVDGDHEPDAVGFDATWARALVTDNGTIAFHDYHAERGDPIKQGLVSWPEPDELVERLAVYRGRWPA